jgi:hypothetical protein
MFPNQSNWESPDQNKFLLEISCPQTPKEQVSPGNALLPKNPRTYSGMSHIRNLESNKTITSTVFEKVGCFHLCTSGGKCTHLIVMLSLHQRLPISTMNQESQKDLVWHVGDLGNLEVTKHKTH